MKAVKPTKLTTRQAKMIATLFVSDLIKKALETADFSINSGRDYDNRLDDAAVNQVAIELRKIAKDMQGEEHL